MNNTDGHGIFTFGLILEETPSTRRRDGERSLFVRYLIVTPG